MSNFDGPVLYWDSAYAIAISLIEQFPSINPEYVGLQELANLVEQLPGFVDDPELANERLLLDIMVCWYEELNN